MLYNEKQAMSEGWLLSERDDGFYEVQKYDDVGVFLTDREALGYVRWCAENGSLMHAEALALDGKPWKAQLHAQH